jgi:hypothetical protein
VADAKVLRWARVIQPMILVLDDLRNSGVRLGHSPHGDGYDHGNGGGRELFKGRLHSDGGGTGNGDRVRSVCGNGYSLVQRDGGGTVIRA